MRKDWLLMMVLGVFLFGSSGCSLFDNTGATHEQIKNTRTTFINPTPDPRIERILYEHFFTSPVEWDVGSWEKVVKARYTAASVYDDLKDRAVTTGTVSSYTIIYTTEFTNKQWQIIRTEMNNHSEKPGAVSEEAQVIWNQARDRIDLQMRQQIINVGYMEKEMDDRVSDTMIQQYNDLFSALQPVIDMVM